MLTYYSDLEFGGLERQFRDLRRQMDRLFSDFERDQVDGGSPWAGPPRQASPRVHIWDMGSELMLRAELPGVSEKDIDLTVQQGVLSLRGKRQESAPEGYSVHRQERQSFTFARTFALPCRVDTEKVQARVKNGVLDVVLPKSPDEQPRQIRVSAS